MNQILLGTDKEGAQSALNLKMANRHGLITGATGSGKTVTLQVLVEQFSQSGVPVVLTDVKGDLSGLAEAGSTNKVVEERATLNKISEMKFSSSPCMFWDIFAKDGVPLRANISEMGPMLLSRVLGLNETQTDVIQIIFKYADDENLELIDISDLKALLQYCADQKDEIKLEYGHIAPQSVAAIVRKVVNLESIGGEQFFTNPSLNINHLIRTNENDQGLINIIDGRKLMLDKKLYSTFLLWILSEVFEELPEVGDPEKPKLVIFFDEAHLLFDDAPKFLTDKIETVVRLIRSKGVGLYFVSQSPDDLTPEILGQLGNKIQHGLRASSEKDRKLVKAISKNYPSNEGYNVEEAILNLGIGESISSFLDEKGVPQPVRFSIHRPPVSKIGPIDESKKKKIFESSPFFDLYKETRNPESAFEKIQKLKKELEETEKTDEKERRKSSGSRRQTATEAFFKSMVRTVGRTLGRELIRGILGSIKR